MAYELNKNTLPLTDESLMPSGKYKGQKMIDVPAVYLMYLYDNNMCNNLVKDYINANKDIILQQAKKDGYASRD